MKIVQLIPHFRLGGTEKAGCVLGVELAKRGHPTEVWGWEGGPRYLDQPPPGVIHRILPQRTRAALVANLVESRPDILHIHYAYYADSIINAISQEPRLKELTVVSTPVFGRPPENRETLNRSSTCVIGCYVYYRLLRWLSMSAQEAVQRGIGFVRLNIAEAPPEPVSSLDPPEVLAARRRSLGIPTDQFIIGRLGRADPGKWNQASEQWVNSILEACPDVAWVSIGFPPERGALRLKHRWGPRFVNFEETSDYSRLCRILSSLDVQVFLSAMGECFAFSIAEAAGLGVPTIGLCTPSRDNGQSEQIVDGISGQLVAGPEQAVHMLKSLRQDSRKLRELKSSTELLNRSRSSAEPVLKRMIAFYGHCRAGWRNSGNLLADEIVREHDAFASDYRKRVASVMSQNTLGRTRWRLQLAIQENYRLFRAGRRIKRLFQAVEIEPAPG